MTKLEAIKATRNAAVLACISGGVTLGAILIAIFTDTGGAIDIWNDPWNIIDVVLVFALAYGVYSRKSRVAAVLLFFLFHLCQNTYRNRNRSDFRDNERRGSCVCLFLR